MTQVMKVQQTLHRGECPNLAVPYEAGFCYCRLYEVTDPNRKDRPGQHQREVFLSTIFWSSPEIHSRRKNKCQPSLGLAPLTGAGVTVREHLLQPRHITLSQRWDRKVVITLNARNDHDRSINLLKICGRVSQRWMRWSSCRIEAE